MINLKNNDFIFDAYNEFEDKPTFIEEAKFAYTFIESYINKDSCKDVLEIGCGPGLLINTISQIYSKKNFTGIDPVFPGFPTKNDKKLKELYSKLSKNNLEFKQISYENFLLTSKKKFDVIFLVNVFEHLGSWKSFIQTISSLLNVNGKCVMLFPNYNFPYESHFRLPIIFNKKITYFIFKKYITKMQTKRNDLFLWESLNFVKLSHLKIELKKNKLKYFIEPNTLDVLVARSKNDPQFIKRQQFLSKLLLFIPMKLINLIFRSKIFNRYIPYVVISISK